MRPVRFRDNDWYAGLAPPEHYEGIEFLNGDKFLVIAEHLRYRIIMPCNTIVTDCTADMESFATIDVPIRSLSSEAYGIKPTFNNVSLYDRHLSFRSAHRQLQGTPYVSLVFAFTLEYATYVEMFQLLEVEHYSEPTTEEGANIAAVSVKSDKLAAVLIALYSNHATVLKGVTYTGF